MNRITRRVFLSTTAAALAASALPVHGQGVGRLRTISYNVLAFRGYPRTKTTRDFLDSRVGEHPELTARALKEFAPDIVTLQEGPAEELVKRFAAELEMNYVWFPGGWEGNDTYPGGFPGAVITPYPIVDSESRPSAGVPHDATLFTRHLGRAELKTPFGRLHVVSVHFHASDHDARMKEAAAVVALIDKLHVSGPVLLQGDLNHRPEDPEYAVWKDAGLIDVAANHGMGQAPTFSSTNPSGHIDYIWATPELGGTSTHAEVLNSPPFAPKPDDVGSYALSDHMPVLVDFDTRQLV